MSAPGISIADPPSPAATLEEKPGAYKSFGGTSFARPHVAGLAQIAASLMPGAEEFPVDAVPFEDNMVEIAKRVESSLAGKRMRRVISERLGIWWGDLAMVGSEKSMQQGWEPDLSGSGGEGASLKVREVRMKSPTHHFLMRETVEKDSTFVLGVWRRGEAQPEEWVKHPEADVFTSPGDSLPAPTPARPRLGTFDI